MVAPDSIQVSSRRDGSGLVGWGEGDLGELAGGGLEVAGGVLGVEASLDGVAGCADLDAVEGREFAGGLEDHPLDEVDAGDLLGDAVLDLEAGVDFEEEEIFLVIVVNEFDGAGVGVMNGFAEEGGGGEEALAGGVREAGGGGFFEDLLVAALGGAVAFAEGEDVALAVAEDLDFDVAGAGDEALEVDGGVAEVGLSEAGDGVEGVGKFSGGVADAHADAAAASGAFEHDRVAEGFGLGEGVGEVLEEAGAGEEWDAAGLGCGAGGVF